MEALDPGTPYASNDEIARILFHIASLLEMVQDNPYRVRAYRRAAFGVLVLPRPLVSYVLAGQEAPLPGVGERIRGRLHELVNTGRMGVYQELLADLGEPIASLLSLRGVGPKTAMRLVGELKIESMHDLLEAARNGRVQALRGFGPKREASLARQADALLSGAA